QSPPAGQRAHRVDALQPDLSTRRRARASPEALPKSAVRSPRRLRASAQRLARLMFFVIPIGSDKAVYGLPWITIGLIVTCVMVYVAAITGFNAIGQWGFRPSAGLSVNIVLCTFVHGGFLHLL